MSGDPQRSSHLQTWLPGGGPSPPVLTSHSPPRHTFRIPLWRLLAQYACSGHPTAHQECMGLKKLLIWEQNPGLRFRQSDF